jgi:hypothetical protein
MRKALAIVLVLGISTFFSDLRASTRNLPHAPAAIGMQDEQQGVWFSAEQLDNLLAPIALYPDPLLAQVLVAATFPDQIDEADRETRAYNDHYDVDSGPWDVSVKSVAHYPTVLHMMADKIDWTTSLGQAYVNQSTDVMDAVQRLRAEARNAGNLATTQQQEVVETDGYIDIYPAQPQYIYVPVYDPAIIYFPRRGFYGPVISFGAGFSIGVWLNDDLDWRQHRVFYHGWERGEHDPDWMERSRRYVHVNNTYVNERYRDVRVNRAVVDQHPNYDALKRYQGVHANVDYSNVRRDQRGNGRPGGQPGPGVPPRDNPPRDNQTIRRNLNPNDPRIDANRGRGNPPGTQQPPGRPPAYVGPPEPQHPQTTPPRYQGPPEPQTPQATPRYQGPPEPQHPQATPPRYQGPPEPGPQRQPGRDQPPMARPPVVQGPPQQPRPQQDYNQRPPNSVFHGGGAPQFDTHASSQRGYDSRQQQNRPTPAPTVRPSPPPRPSGPPSQPRGGAGRRP